MAGILDLEKFTFVGDTLKGVGELSFELMRDTRNALMFTTTYGNIKVDTEVGFMGKGGLIGKAAQGCDPTAQSFAANTRKVKWEPKDWEVLLHLCYKDLDGTIAEYERKSGVRKPDFTQSDYEAVVEMVLARALNEFLWRFLWFSDTAAKNIAAGGVITAGVDTGYFTIINGYWKQIFTQCTSNAAQRITISENAASTKAAQVVTAAQAKAYLDSVYYAAPIELRNQPDRFILVTQNLWDAYEQYLCNVNSIQLESVMSNLIEGQKALKIHGVEVIAVPEWDENIISYEDNGTTLHKPYRALYTCKAVLGSGFDNESDFDKLDVWYDRDSRKVKIEGMGNGDAKLLHPGLFVAAY